MITLISLIVNPLNFKNSFNFTKIRLKIYKIYSFKIEFYGFYQEFIDFFIISFLCFLKSHNDTTKCNLNYHTLHYFSSLGIFDLYNDSEF
ncbi:hypothetical protein CHAB381_0967 [Campylobacter hominis ATCC BAA-381]|uniref:Uncharacterized protein n=1 Tax=Campylobacter hominis (strain ATCC BAA-381 / DSM 21671 / CCUG 45161 / LMG 19568 / NCTC 13146 / CH001A) TaxID=360107 RepID=A7I1Y7_CAMHC|nr:hypothetical protein CHAB381_0967 [Campylobacter hominis ATCC BAA-381]